MKRTILLWTTLALVLSGCLAEGDPETFYIISTRLINRTAQCQLRATSGTSEVVPIGTMDLLQTNRYILFPVVKNGFLSVDNVTGLTEENLLAEPNNITITGAWVSYEIDGLQGSYLLDEDLDADGIADILQLDADQDGEPDYVASDFQLPEKVFVPTSGFAETEDEVSVALEIIPPTVGMLLDMDKSFNKFYSGGILQTTVVLQAFMGDGTEIHSTEYHFPLRLCRGCLVFYDKEPQNCCQFDTEPDMIPCYPGQEEPSSCSVACMNLDGVDRQELKQAMVRRELRDLSGELTGTDTE